MMTAGELIEILSDVDEDTEVRLAMQPEWPFEHSVGAVVHSDEIREGEEDDGEATPDQGVVWLAERGQIGYLPSSVAEAAW